MRVLDVVAAGERRICPLRLVDVFARVFLGIDGDAGDAGDAGDGRWWAACYTSMAR